MKKRQDSWFDRYADQGIREIAKWLWRLAYAYFPTVRYEEAVGFESHLVHQISRARAIVVAQTSVLTLRSTESIEMQGSSHDYWRVGQGICDGTQPNSNRHGTGIGITEDAVLKVAGPP